MAAGERNLRALGRVNPLSYQVDALPVLNVQGGQPAFAPLQDFVVLLIVLSAFVMITAKL
jgi:hypothetical protein